MFDIDSLMDKWSEIGLLQNLSEDVKRNLAIKYELVAMYLIEKDEYVDNVVLTNCIFPIMYRIYNNGKTIGDIPDFIDEVNNFINDETILANIENYNIEHGNNIDIEAELCAIFTENYKTKKDIEPIKWMNKHKL